MFYDILETKNAFLDHKNKKFKEPKNWDFSKKVSPWFLSKIGNIFFFFIFGRIFPKNEFHEILQRKSSFLDYKNNKF